MQGIIGVIFGTLTGWALLGANACNPILAIIIGAVVGFGLFVLEDKLT